MQILSSHFKFKKWTKKKLINLWWSRESTMMMIILSSIPFFMSCSHHHHTIKIFLIHFFIRLKSPVAFSFLLEYALHCSWSVFYGGIWKVCENFKNGRNCLFRWVREWISREFIFSSQKMRRVTLSFCVLARMFCLCKFRLW